MDWNSWKLILATRKLLQYGLMKSKKNSSFIKYLFIPKPFYYRILEINLDSSTQSHTNAAAAALCFYSLKKKISAKTYLGLMETNYKIK